MRKNKKILISAKLSDKKLLSKILPIIEQEDVKEIYLIRNKPLFYKKILNFYPSNFYSKNIFLTEIYRFLVSIYVIIRYKPDLIIGINYYMNGIFCALFGKIFKIKYILMIIGDPQIYIKSIFYKRILLSAYKVAVRGNYSKDYINKIGIDNNKIFIAHNVFEIHKDINLQNKYKKIYDFIYIGNFVKIKRIDFIVRIFNILKNKNYNFKVVFVGNGPLFEKISNLIKKNNLEKEITLTGYQEDIEKYIIQSKFLVMASEHEGLPMSLIECMAHGVPAILPKVGDINDIVKNGYNSYVCDPLDEASYIKNFEKILKNDILYNDLSANCIKTTNELQNEYSLENNKNIWRRILSY